MPNLEHHVFLLLTDKTKGSVLYKAETTVSKKNITKRGWIIAFITAYHLLILENEVYIRMVYMTIKTKQHYMAKPVTKGQDILSSAESGYPRDRCSAVLRLRIKRNQAFRSLSQYCGYWSTPTNSPYLTMPSTHVPWESGIDYPTCMYDVAENTPSLANFQETAIPALIMSEIPMKESVDVVYSFTSSFYCAIRQTKTKPQDQHHPGMKSIY